MKTLLSSTFLLKIPGSLLLAVVIALSPGCLVSGGKYSRTLEEKTTCMNQLSTCLAEREEENQEARTRVSELERGNRALIDDLAGLSAEKEELAHRLRSCQKHGRGPEDRAGGSDAAYQNLTAYLSQEIQEGKIRIDGTESRLRLNLVDKILFPSGSATLTPKGKEILRKVGGALKETRDRRILIEGHTDDVAISPKAQNRFSSNWDLSALRATAVVAFLQAEVEIDPRLLSAAGYSMYQPLVPNDTPEHKQINRRIEILLIPISAADFRRLTALP